MDTITTAIVNWLQSVFHDAYWVTAFISVVPMIEVRGAITVGVNLGLDPWIAYVLSCCSALVVCPLLLLCLKPILRALKRTKLFKNIASAVEEMFAARAKKIENNAEKEDVKSSDDQEAIGRKKKFNKILGVFLFVAIPLPMTGVWTGSAVAAFLDLEYRYSVPAIVVGNFVAGLIITVLNIILGKYSSLILLILALFVAVTIVALLVTFVVKYRKLKKEKATESTASEQQK
ncbi:MAG: small multi-drug export protein [Clostridia bacterium]|nr:small multi-drug export protein [Clostridia bacterium]